MHWNRETKNVKNDFVCISKFQMKEKVSMRLRRLEGTGGVREQEEG